MGLCRYWVGGISSLLNASITLANSHITLPDAQDMLPIAAQLWQQGKVVAVENVEPTYLRNEVTWKKLPGRE